MNSSFSYYQGKNMLNKFLRSLLWKFLHFYLVFTLLWIAKQILEAKYKDVTDGFMSGVKMGPKKLTVLTTIESKTLDFPGFWRGSPRKSYALPFSFGRIKSQTGKIRQKCLKDCFANRFTKKSWLTDEVTSDVAAMLGDFICIESRTVSLQLFDNEQQAIPVIV